MNINIKGVTYVVISGTHTHLLSQFKPTKLQYSSSANIAKNIMVKKGLINT